MTADPRVEAVAEAMDADVNAYVNGEHRNPPNNTRMATVAVVALDAYDKEHPRVVWSEYEALIKDTVEADLRERIAREIEAMADEYRTHDEIDSMQGEVKDQLHAAVRIARGTDPGKDTR